MDLREKTIPSTPSSTSTSPPSATKNQSKTKSTKIFLWKKPPSGSRKKIWVIFEERITRSDNSRTEKSTPTKELGEPIPTRDRKLKRHSNKLPTQFQQKQPRESRETVVLVFSFFLFLFSLFFFFLFHLGPIASNALVLESTMVVGGVFFQICKVGALAIMHKRTYQIWLEVLGEVEKFKIIWRLVKT